MLQKIVLLALVTLSAGSAPVETNISPKLSQGLLIGAFNVQVFGKSKMSKPEVVEVLVQILQRYDIIVIQEIRDIDEVAFPELVDDLNAASGPTKPYGSYLGPREGRTSSKEQYGFIYRSDLVMITEQYKYTDSKDVFEREPYVVQFTRKTATGNQVTFNYIPLHAKPDDAINELNALVDVYYNSVAKTGLEDALIGGDLNADCSYVCSSCWGDVNLKDDPPFRWLTPDTADTTVGSTDCAYDRIIVAGDSMISNSADATIFNFEQEYNLPHDLALDVSDHYPVEFYLN